MILEQYKKSQLINGQELLYMVSWAGKPYYLFQDIDGTIYSTKIADNGDPVWI